MIRNQPENILLVSNMADSELKVGDFGLSKILDGDQVIMKTSMRISVYSLNPMESHAYLDSLWHMGVLRSVSMKSLNGLGSVNVQHLRWSNRNPIQA